MLQPRSRTNETVLLEGVFKVVVCIFVLADIFVLHETSVLILLEEEDNDCLVVGARYL